MAHRRPARPQLVRSAAMLALVGALAGSATADIGIVTSPSTAIESIELDLVPELWLGAVKRVGNQVVEVADRGDALRKVFYEHVLEKSRGQVKAIRAKRAFQEGIVPPPTFPDATQMIRWVGAEANRLGYVDADAAGESLKVLLVISTPAENE